VTETAIDLNALDQVVLAALAPLDQSDLDELTGRPAGQPATAGRLAAELWQQLAPDLGLGLARVGVAVRLGEWSWIGRHGDE
jgi:hypothetical protein